MGDMSVVAGNWEPDPCTECGEPSLGYRPALCQVHTDERHAQWEDEQQVARIARREELIRDHAEDEVTNLAGGSRYEGAELSDPRLKAWGEARREGSAWKGSVT